MDDDAAARVSSVGDEESLQNLKAPRTACRTSHRTPGGTLALSSLTPWNVCLSYWENRREFAVVQCTAQGQGMMN